MRSSKIVVLTALVQLSISFATTAARAQAAAPYPTMAPLDQYLISDVKAEIALARSAAPASISDDADIMALGPKGYTTVAKGSNGFVCIVERSWGATTDFPQFWNPKMRAPHCFNPSAVESFLPIYLMKTQLVLAGKSPAEILAATTSAFDKKELPALSPGAMVYMLSKQQYLNDQAQSWHPHLMFLVPGDAERSWGANLAGSPVIASNDLEERVTIFMVCVSQWSDGTPANP